MYKITIKNGEIFLFSHFETVFYKIFVITNSKKEALKASDACLWLKSGEKYVHVDFIIELI